MYFSNSNQTTTIKAAITSMLLAAALIGWLTLETIRSPAARTGSPTGV